MFEYKIIKKIGVAGENGNDTRKSISSSGAITHRASTLDVGETASR